MFNIGVSTGTIMSNAGKLDDVISYLCTGQLTYQADDQDLCELIDSHRSVQTMIYCHNPSKVTSFLLADHHKFPVSNSS